MEDQKQDRGVSESGLLGLSLLVFVRRALRFRDGGDPQAMLSSSSISASNLIMQAITISLF